MLRGGRAGGQGYRAGGHHRERAAATPRRAALVAALADPRRRPRRPRRPRTGQRHLAPETRASARLGATALDSVDLLGLLADRCVVSVVVGKLGSHLLEYTKLVIV